MHRPICIGSRLDHRKLPGRPHGATSWRYLFDNEIRFQMGEAKPVFRSTSLPPQRASGPEMLSGAARTDHNPCAVSDKRYYATQFTDMLRVGGES